MPINVNCQRSLPLNVRVLTSNTVWTTSSHVWRSLL